MKTKNIVLIVIGILILYSIYYYNSVISSDENVLSSWAQIENVYQRRADLIPNLVEVVKGYAVHENETLLAVTEARAKLGGQINLGSDMLNNPQAFKQFQQTQGALTSALQRLMVVVEKYPDLKADKNFSQLQSQLEGTENRISVERMRYIKAVQKYNDKIRGVPGSIYAKFLGLEKREQFQAQKGVEQAPQVKF